MSDLLSYIWGNVGYILRLMNDEVFGSFFGTTFLYVAISCLFIWIAVNIFIIRPLVGGALIDSTVTAASINAHRRSVRSEIAARDRRRSAERSKVKTTTRTVYSKPDRNGDRRVVSEKRVVVDPVKNTRTEYIDK